MRMPARSKTEAQVENILSPFYVIPKRTFFNWGFTIKKSFYPELIAHFGFCEGHLVEKIELIIEGKSYEANARMARIDNSSKAKGRSSVKYPERNVVQFFYNKNYDTLKALRKLFIFSYASTIDKKSKPELKELLEFIHLGGNRFKLKPISRQETPFDAMLRFLEDRNLFGFWEDQTNRVKGKKDKLFVDYSKKWISVNDIEKHRLRNNVIYLLFHSKEKKIYIGKANNLEQRIKAGKGRVGMPADWDKFKYFELNPKYSYLLDDIEMHSLKLITSILKNDLGVQELSEQSIEVVNKQLV